MFFDVSDKIIKLAENFYLITAPNKSRFPFCNTFLFTGKENVLVDAGINKDTLIKIDKKIRIDKLVISHSHPDHILNWSLLKDRYIFMPKETPDAIKDLNLLGQRFMGTPEKGNHWVQLIGDMLGVRPFREPDERFQDGDILYIGDFQLKAIHAPGHLNDHYAFFEQKTGTLLSSDIDFSGFGPFYGQPECNIERFKNSIKKIMTLPYKQVCSSHKAPIVGDATENFKTFLNGFKQHQQKILSVCNTPCTLDEIITKSPLYNGRMPDKILQNTFEGGMISKGLVQMIDKGIIKKMGNKYVSADYIGGL